MGMRDVVWTGYYVAGWVGLWLLWFLWCIGCCLLVVGYGGLLVRSCLSFASVFVIDCLLISGWVDCMWCG